MTDDKVTSLHLHRFMKPGVDAMQRYDELSRSASREMAETLNHSNTLGFRFVVQNCIARAGDARLDLVGLVRQHADILDQLPRAEVAEMKALHERLAVAYGGVPALNRVERDMIDQGASNEVLAAFYQMPHGPLDDAGLYEGNWGRVAEVTVRLLDYIGQEQGEDASTYASVLELMREWYT